MNNGTASPLLPHEDMILVSKAKSTPITNILAEKSQTHQINTFKIEQGVKGILEGAQFFVPFGEE